MCIRDRFSVNGVFNAIFVHGNVLGDAMFYGSGAGKLPTASAVVADVVDAAKHLNRNIMMNWSSKKLELMDISQVEERFFVRMKGSVAADGDVYKRQALICRAMDLGYYEGVNLSLAYCDDCGHQELEMDVCPVCGSTNLTKIDRMNGYLSYSRVHGDTRLNDAKKMCIRDR